MIIAGAIVDTPGDPFSGDPMDALAVDQDGALLVRDGVIRARGSLAALRAAHPGEQVTRLDGGILVPGFVDTHVHFPQFRAIGGLGLPLRPAGPLSQREFFQCIQNFVAIQLRLPLANPGNLQ